MDKTAKRAEANSFGIADISGADSALGELVTVTLESVEDSFNRVLTLVGADNTHRCT